VGNACRPYKSVGFFLLWKKWLEPPSPSRITRFRWDACHGYDLMKIGGLPPYFIYALKFKNPNAVSSCLVVCLLLHSTYILYFPD
jgi:hypothetical protein